MSNHHVNRLRLAGEAEAMKAFAASVRDGDDHFSVELANLDLTDDDVRLVAETDTPETSESNGLSVVEYVLVTRRGAPWDLAERLSAGRDMVVSLASVEPGNRHAEVRVYGHGRSWQFDMEQSDYDQVESECEENDEDVAEGLLDTLQSDSASVVDDYERIAPTPPPGM